jgi:hypothetical protein
MPAAVDLFCPGDSSCLWPQHADCRPIYAAQSSKTLAGSASLNEYWLNWPHKELLIRLGEDVLAKKVRHFVGEQLAFHLKHRLISDFYPVFVSFLPSDMLTPNSLR